MRLWLLPLIRGDHDENRPTRNHERLHFGIAGLPGKTDEAALEVAYELGRRGLSHETSLIEMVTLHSDAFGQIVSSMPQIQDFPKF